MLVLSCKTKFSLVTVYVHPLTPAMGGLQFVKIWFLIPAQKTSHWRFLPDFAKAALLCPKVSWMQQQRSPETFRNPGFACPVRLGSSKAGWWSNPLGLGGWIRFHGIVSWVDLWSPGIAKTDGFLCSRWWLSWRKVCKFLACRQASMSNIVKHLQVWFDGLCYQQHQGLSICFNWRCAPCQGFQVPCPFYITVTFTVFTCFYYFMPLCICLNFVIRVGWRPGFRLVFLARVS